MSTVREAVKGLSTIGLVDVRSGRGTRVSPNAVRLLDMMTLIRADLENVEFVQAYEARAAVEVVIARLAASRATETDQERIRRALDDMRANVDSSDAFRRADWRFHLAVADAAKNPILAQMYQLASGILGQMLRVTLEQPGSRQRGLRYQADLLEAIVEHDPARAAQSAQEHMACFVADWLNASQQAALLERAMGLRRPDLQSGMTPHGPERG
jgi:GntR family transcriptional repressor for pyruvate dehydrogenase complex